MHEQLKFLDLAEALLNEAGLNGKQLTAEKSDLYSLKIESISVDISGNQKGFINLFAFVDEFVMLSYPALLTLALQNGYQHEYPAISFSILMLDNDKSRVSLWMRFPLKEVTPADLNAAFARLVSTAQQIQQWLEKEFAADQHASQAAAQS